MITAEELAVGGAVLLTGGDAGGSNSYEGDEHVGDGNHFEREVWLLEVLKWKFLVLALLE